MVVWSQLVLALAASLVIGVVGNAAAQTTPTTTPTPTGAPTPEELTLPPPSSAPTPTPGAASVQIDATDSIGQAAAEADEGPASPRPTPPPGGALGVNLAPAPEIAIDESSGDLDDDPLFLPAALLIGGGSAVLLASLFTGLGAHGVYSDLERDCPGNLCVAGSQNRIDNGQTLAVVSTVLTFVGIVAAGTGTALMIVAANRVGERPPEQARLQLTGGPSGLGLGARASF